MAGRFSVETVFKGVDRVSAPVTRMQNRVGKFTRAAERGFKRASKALNGMARGLARGVRNALGVATVAATGAYLAINKVAGAADDLAKQSRRLDFPIEELQEWGFVAEQSGVDSALLNSSLGAFSKRLGEAAGGMGPLVSGLKNINPGLLEQLKNTDNVAEAFDLYVKAMRESDSATERAALANAAFSRSGLKLANIADLDATAVANLRKEMRQNGIITKEQAEAAEAFNDAMNSLKRSLMGTLQQVLLPMMPALTDLLRNLREWTVANKDLIKSKVFEAFDTIKSTVIFLADHGGTILKTVAAFTALVVVMNTLAAVLTLINLIAMANPITLIALGVVAAIAAISALVVWVDELLAGFDKLPRLVQLALAPLKVFLKGVKFVKDAFGEGFSTAVSNFVTGSGDGPDGVQIQSPQERTARSIEEHRNTEKSEVTIKDETKRARVTSGKLGAGTMLRPSGAF